MTDTFQPKLVKPAATDEDVQVMKTILKSMSDVNEQVPTFDVNHLLNQLVDAILDLPESDYERFGLKFATLFVDTVRIRKESEGEPFLIFKADELGEHVSLDEFRRYEASADLHNQINSTLVRTGVRPARLVPKVSPNQFSVIRRSSLKEKDEAVEWVDLIDNSSISGIPTRLASDSAARDVKEIQKFKDIVENVDLETTDVLDAAETNQAYDTPSLETPTIDESAPSDLEIRVRNLETSIQKVLENEYKNLEMRSLERESIDLKLNEILETIKKT